MIFVGNKPPEEVLYGHNPEEPIAKLPKDSKDKDDPVMFLNGIDKNTGIARINRIMLSRSAVVELLNVESPSRIWVRLTNHIAGTTLNIIEPYDWIVKTDLKVGDYALVPIDERALRRVRIEELVRNSNNEVQYVKVFFIDDAITSWVDPNVVIEMDEHYMFYPWQAIQVSLFGIYPGNGDKWTSECCDNLAELLKSFRFLKIEVQLGTVAFNDYARPIPVNIYGLDSETERRRKNDASITDLLLSQGELPIARLPITNSALHQLFDFEKQIEDKNNINVNDIHKYKPNDWREKRDEENGKNDETIENYADWDPLLCQVPMFTKQDFIRFTDRKTGNIMLSIEGTYTKSPYEWYARPIQKIWLDREGKSITMEKVYEMSGDEVADLQETDEIRWMIYGNDDLLNDAEALDTFYSNANNRKPLLPTEIQSIRKQNREVYAVCAVNEERSAYTGEWQRVQILSCDQFAEVRFLDSGGRDMVLTTSLYKIHEQHCRYPPKCLAFSLHGVCPSKTEKWPVAECSKFKILLRGDVPVKIAFNDVELLNSKKRYDTMTEIEQRPYEKKHVCFVKDFSVFGEKVSMKQQFIGDDPGQAKENASKPLVWDNVSDLSFPF